MPSKSKDVRIEQRRILEKKLDLRLQQLAQKGISKEKAQSDPLVKNLKAKIKETNIRISTVDKFVKLTQKLAEAKAQKSAELAKKEEVSEPAAMPEPVASEPKQKKKTAAPAEDQPKPKKKAPAADAAEKEKEPKPKKKAAADTGAEPKKQPRKKKEESPKE